MSFDIRSLSMSLSEDTVASFFMHFEQRQRARKVLDSMTSRHTCLMAVVRELPSATRISLFLASSLSLCVCVCVRASSLFLALSRSLARSLSFSFSLCQENWVSTLRELCYMFNLSAEELCADCLAPVLQRSVAGV